MRIALLQSMVGDAERLVDKQIKTAEVLDRKAEQMITLAVATLGAALTIALFVANSERVNVGPLFEAIFGFGVLLNLVGVMLFVNAYAGFRTHHESHVGPDARWLVQKLDDPGWDLELHLDSLIRSFAAYAQYNMARMKVSARSARRGLFTLVAGVALYVAALALIVAGSMN